MLRQIEWEVQNEPITKNGILLVATSFFFFVLFFFVFFNFVSVHKPLTKSRFDVPTTQISVFKFLVSAGVLFEGAFSL